MQIRPQLPGAPRVEGVPRTFGEGPAPAPVDSYGGSADPGQGGPRSVSSSSSSSSPSPTASSPAAPPPPVAAPAPAAPPQTLVQLDETPPTPLVDTHPAPEAIALASEMVVGRDLPGGVRHQAVLEISSLPLPWLRRLAAEDVAVAVVRDGQSLADTGILPAMTPERCRKHFPQAREIALRTVQEESAKLEEQLAREGADEGRAAMDRYWLPDQVRDALLPRLNDAGIGFSVELAREPVDLARLAAGKNIPADDMETWTTLLAELNQGLAVVEDGSARADHGVLLVPYIHHQGRPISEVSRESFGQFDFMTMRNHRGLHSWPNRLLAVHEAFVRDPADEVGHYRVLCHELGHAIDYAAEGLAEFGSGHRETVDRLYEADRAAYARGEVRFLTERAMDDAREYFAEAVEAWMTRRVGDDQDFYKPQNSREDLQVRNPELFAYLSRLMAS